MRQSGHNSAAVCLCITCSGSRQSFFVGFALMDLHRSISAVGIIGFHYRPYPSGSHAVFGNGTDDAYRSTFRHDIPHREYASSFTADFKCHPCQMVYCRNQEIMIEGLSISYAQGEMSILMLMAVVLLLISLKKFNKRLE